MTFGVVKVGCIELLRTCHLNRHRGPQGQSGYYTLTNPTEQRAVLRALGLERLGDETAVQRAATPRLIATEQPQHYDITGIASTGRTTWVCGAGGRG